MTADHSDFLFSTSRKRFYDSAYDSVASENQIVGVGSISGRINQSQCPLPRFVIGLVIPLQLTTQTTYCSLDRKCRSRKRNQNAVFSRS